MSSEGMEQRNDAATSGGDVKERTIETVAEVDAAAMHVAGVAGDEAGHVAHEAKRAARGFFDETRTQVTEQASTQQRRAAEALRTTGDEFTAMAESASSDGMAAGLVRGLGRQTSQAASWLEQREPADLVQEVRGFARRHTGAFLLAAVGIGVVAGRLTRALMAERENGGGTSSGGMSSGAGGSAGAARPVGVGGAGVSASTGTGAGYGVSGAGYGATPAGAGAPGMAGAGAGAPGMTGATGATGVPGGDTPIGDSLASEPAGTDEDQWSPTGEARR